MIVVCTWRATNGRLELFHREFKANEGTRQEETWRCWQATLTSQQSFPERRHNKHKLNKYLLAHRQRPLHLKWPVAVHSFKEVLFSNLNVSKYVHCPRRIIYYNDSDCCPKSNSPPGAAFVSNRVRETRCEYCIARRVFVRRQISPSVRWTGQPNVTVLASLHIEWLPANSDLRTA